MPTPPRSTLVVGGPAYYTPEGYEAPRQPVQSFMPTDTRPDPIGDQFRRANPPPAQTAPPPPPPPVPAPTPAPAPISDPEPIIDPVEEPVVEPDFPIYSGPGQAYIPGLTPFPGIPGLGDLDFSGLPGMGDIDIDAIIQEYQDRIDAGEPEPFDSFLPTPPPPAGPAPQEDDPNFLAFQQTPQYQDFINSGGMGTMDMYTASDGRTFGSGTVGRMYDEYLASLGQADSNTVAPEPEFVPPPQEPNGFFPGIDFSDFEDFDFGDYGDNRYKDLPGQYDYTGLSGDIDIPPSTTTGPLTGTFGNFGPFTPPPSRIETPQMGGRPSLDFSDLGNFNLR